MTSSGGKRFFGERVIVRRLLREKQRTGEKN